MSRSEARLAFRNGELRSTVWKFWTQGNEAYVQSRMMGSSCKISLHNSGKCSWSMTSEWMAGDGAAHFKSQSRHLCTWAFDPAATTPELVCRICVPYSELSTVDKPERLKAVRWCEGLDPSQAGYFIVYFVPQFPDDAVIEMPHQPVAGFQLKNGRGILVCAEKRVMSEENLAQLKQGRTELRELAARGGIQHIPKQYRAVLVCDSGSYRTFIEIVPSK